MSNSLKDKSMAQLLGAIRTSGTKVDKAAEELLFRLTKRKNWSHQSCQVFYESVLKYYVDDEHTLEWLLAVSGRADGYRSIQTATARRIKYFEHLQATGSSPWPVDIDFDSIRKAEDTQLEFVAQKLEDDLESNNISHLIEKWIPEPVKEPLPGRSDTLSPCTLIPPVEELFPTAKEIELIPGEIFQLKVAILPRESVDAPLAFVSSKPTVVTVSANGMLKAEERQEKLWHNIRKSSPFRALFDYVEHTDPERQTAEIFIQAESGITATKLVTVNYAKGIYKSQVTDINNFVPRFIVQQTIRILGTTDWIQAVDAEIGDVVEFQIQYKNTSEDNRTQNSVMIKDIMPNNLRYVPGTTVLYSSNHPKGLAIDQDTIITTGINIGHYNKGTNAFIRFTAEVVDNSLQCGSNTLVNWSQACANGVTLQDYTTVTLQKVE